jgi:hypothetical protein
LPLAKEKPNLKHEVLVKTLSIISEERGGKNTGNQRWQESFKASKTCENNNKKLK